VGNGILLNISDPVHPLRIDAVSDPNYAFWHFRELQQRRHEVMFTDEWGRRHATALALRRIR